ncbi:MAG TPA: cytochrome c biogenesis heme-transporting ATPase CcmA [Usitatibacter sp.]|nr:cytochrome c biogenesis heme-transporting ATPase CcmA [Usitatibacter sp.]
MNRLEARALGCSRGPARLFRDVSFEARAGEWVALRGPNGSGKTTLLRCAAGLAHADAGETFWNGVSTAREREAFRACLLYAGHLPGIKDDFSAEENLQAALGLRGVAVEGAALRSALETVGLAARRRLPARRLSAGQRRRIGLARLALDPAPLWMLDEPLTALDDEGQALFGRLLARHLGCGGLAVISTHHALTPAPAREVRLGP